MKAFLAQHLWWLSTRKAVRRQREAMANPKDAQARVLRRLLRSGANTVFGREHGLAGVREASDLASAIQTRSHDQFAPWLDRAWQGEHDVLSPGHPSCFERSSGSSGPRKLIPHNSALRSEFSEAVNAWMGAAMDARPSLRQGPAYWLLSPLGRTAETSPGGVAVGLADDTAYLSPLAARIAAAGLATPSALSAVSHHEHWSHLVLRLLLQQPELRFASFWHPSLPLLLMEQLERDRDLLLDALASGRSGLSPGADATLPAAVRQALRSDPSRARQLRAARQLSAEAWPKLDTLSCWFEGNSDPHRARLQESFPKVRLEAKGLIATEGVVTIPWPGAPAPVPALNSHFLEFLETPDGPPRGVHELEDGGVYEVLLSTGGGFWRYRLGDSVRVAGRCEATPCLEFAGRVDSVCDLRGEKLSPTFVQGVIHELFAPILSRASFALLAPVETDPPGYVLWLDPETSFDPVSTPAHLDCLLRANPHYDFARRSGQLAPARIRPTRPHPERLYLDRCLALGQRLGDIKPTPLHRTAGWEKTLAPS